MENNKRLLILDVSSILYRAFFALPPLKTKSGIETGALYGFTTTLLKAIKDMKATHVVACFDTPAPTFRHGASVDYKAHRPKTPDGIIAQIPLVKDLLKIFCIPMFEREGFEADDLIATICVLVQQENNVDIYVVSGDLDNLQLVNDRVKVYTFGKGINDTVIYDIIKVRERFGVEPLQMNELKALIGDPSDNIPGAKGIGKKTAAEIIQKYHTIVNLYNELSTDTAVLKQRTKEILREIKENVLLSRKLVETKKDIPLSFDFSISRLSQENFQQAEDLFQDLEFRTLIPRLSSILQ